MKHAKSAPPTGAFERARKLLQLSASLAAKEVTTRVGKRLRENSSAATTLARVQQATQLVQELSHLKGAAMKLGQMLALEGRDFLPPEIILVLERLQNQGSFLPLETVQEILERELGEKWADLHDLSNPPIAAASIGQVHTATYGSQKVAIKIQYPGIRDTVHADVRVLKKVLSAFVALSRKKIEVDGILEELTEVFVQETDYLAEAKFAIQYRSAASALPVIVPKVFTEMSSTGVLTLEYIEGKPLTVWLREDTPSLEERERLAHLILEVYTREFTEWGLVQTDPNPGNFLIQPKTGKLVLFDFGATKQYSPEFRRMYANLITSAYDQDRDGVLQAAFRMGVLDPREETSAREAFIELAFASMQPFRAPSFRFSDGEFLEASIALSRKFVQTLRHTPPPRELIFLHRKLSGIYQILRRLGVTLELGPYMVVFDRFRPPRP